MAAFGLADFKYSIAAVDVGTRGSLALARTSQRSWQTGHSPRGPVRPRASCGRRNDGILESVFGCRSSDPRLVRGAGFHQERRPHCRDVARERALITAELERLENEVPVGLLNHF